MNGKSDDPSTALLDLPSSVVEAIGSKDASTVPVDLPSPVAEAINLDVHRNAEDLIRKSASDYTVALIMRSKSIAFERGADIVMTSHVKEADRELRPPTLHNSSLKQMKTVVGGALLGAFASSYVAELAKGGSEFLTLVAIGYAGMLLIYLGLRR